MKKKIFCLVLAPLLFASSCQKCHQCKQYCAYCIPTANTGVTYKFCSSKDVTYITIDSIYTLMQNNGYDCSKLKKEQRVCDSKSKLNDALDYYLLQDYYCYPAE